MIMSLDPNAGKNIVKLSKKDVSMGKKIKQSTNKFIESYDTFLSVLVYRNDSISK